MLFIILLYISKEISAVNVALYKTGQFCQAVELSENIFDGSDETFEIFKERCVDNVNIMIDLGDDYLIHYVIITKGTNYDASWDYFFVMTYRLLHPYPCSHYPKQATPNNKLRVNCNFWNMHFRKVQIVMKNNNTGFNITEIEVHSLARINSSAKIYRGCHKKFVHLKTYRYVKNCFQYCAGHDYGVVALQKRSPFPCLCGESYNETKEVDLSECKWKCGKQKDPCGGPDRYSIYIVLVNFPYYKACCEHSNEIMSNEPVMSISDCLRFCDNSSFVMVKADVGGADKCRCGVVPECEHSNVNPRLCNTSCDATSQNCDKSHTMIYGTCKHSYMKTVPCSKLFHCDRWDEYGACSTQCASEFSGDHCMKKALPQTEKLERPMQGSLDGDDDDDNENETIDEGAKADELLFKLTAIDLIVIVVVVNLIGIGAYVCWRATKETGSASSSGSMD